MADNLPAELFGDELRIKQILNNLLSNAFKYTQKGKVILSISFKKDGDSVKLICRVSDTGQGIKDEDTKHLFTEYLRFNQEANRTTEGTGLGLSITKELAEMMDGDIGVESEYGKGSVFTVTVKQLFVNEKIIGAEAAQKLRDFTYTDKKGDTKLVRKYMPLGTVLVVDDVGTNLYVARGLLAPYGLSIDMVKSGMDTINRIKQGKVYDIILMDHMMPEMDGIETVKILRGMGYQSPIVALTANAISGQAEIFKQNGFDDFISKPIDILQLDAVLNKWIRTKTPNAAAEDFPSR
jgi:CheY-like chemotaxis protein/anti-sigma regulatory factor (Ser/Thr protein kinase)